MSAGRGMNPFMGAQAGGTGAGMDNMPWASMLSGGGASLGAGLAIN